MISYDGLYEQLRRKGITKTDLTSEIGISSRTIAKIAKGEKLSNKTMEKIAAFLEKDETMILEVTVDREELC